MKTDLSKMLTAFAAVAALVLGATAFAHEGHDHGDGGGEKVKGTVKSLTDKTMVVTTGDGKDITLDVMDMTKFERSGKATTAADVAVGEKVIVTAMKGGTSGAHAMIVKVGKKAKAKATTAAAKTAPSPDGGVQVQGASDSAKHGAHKHDGH